MDEPKPIGAEFYNSETNVPHTHCMTCNCELIESGKEYFIERMMRKLPSLNMTETLFEYAMCMKCATDFRGDMSEESMAAIETHFREKARFISHDPESENVLDRCLITGIEISECSEFSYHAYCRGSHMVSSIFPYAISDVAMEEISELLSDETIDELDDFKGKYFTGPPEIAELLNPKRFVPI